METGYQARATSAYGEPEPSQVTIRDQLNSTRNRLDYLADLIGKLEDHIDGPQPRSAQTLGKDGGVAPPYVGIHIHVGQIDRAADDLGNRLANLLTRI